MAEVETAFEDLWPSIRQCGAEYRFDFVRLSLAQQSVGPDPRGLVERARRAVIPPRSGSSVAGLLFAANFVLHSGVDDAGGHFVAAYRIDAMEGAPSAGCPV
jgi:hypothetical protein